MLRTRQREETQKWPHSEMEHAGVYENLLHEPGLHDMIARFYAAMNPGASTQSFLREVTPDLVKAIGW